MTSLRGCCILCLITKRTILVRVFLLILLMEAKNCFALKAGMTGKIGGDDGIDRETDNDADDDEDEDEFAATADAGWDEDAGAKEVEVTKIPEPLQRLLRGPCMRSAPTLVTGIEREQTGHGARTVMGCLALVPVFRREASSHGAVENSVTSASSPSIIHHPLSVIKLDSN